MIVPNTPENRDIRDVCATLAIENMYLPKEFIEEVMKIDRGEKTYEELRQEIIREYSR